VYWSDVIEATPGQALLYPINELAGHAKDRRRHVTVGHEGILTH